MDHKYQEIAQDFQNISILSSVTSLLSWDNAVMMLKNGITRRSKEIALVSNLIHKQYKQKDYLKLIEDLDQSNLDEWQKANLKVIKHHLSHQVIIPEKLNNEFTENGVNCEFLWRDAKKNNDFAKFAEAFKPVLNNIQEIAEIKSQNLGISKYDSLLDYYEPGLRESDFQNIFNTLATKLPDLIDKVIAKQEDKIKFDDKNFPIEKQKAIVRRFTKLLGLTDENIRIDESSHPFCTGHKGDVRITTRYSKSEFLTSLFGIIHESGHAIYDLNTPEKYSLDPVGGCLGMSIHESQSLFYEMQVATSYDFIKLAHKILTEEFDINDQNFTAKNLYGFLNHVEKKYIRVDSDEVTYPLHIIMRYEIEKKLIEKAITVNDLPDVWEFYLDKFFGLKYKDHATGCLQDIHWTDGSLGYFPCYSLGAIFASQLKQKFDNENPNFKLDEQSIHKYQEFLSDNVHKFGSLKSSGDLALDLFDTKYDSEIYLNYLNKKYLNG